MSKSDLSGDLHLEVENYKGAAGKVDVDICKSGVYLAIFRQDYEKDDSENLLEEVFGKRHQVLLTSKECRTIAAHLIKSADILDRDARHNP
jgi:hypothetical protein